MSDLTAPLPRPQEVTYHLVDSSRALESEARHWQLQEAVALDTEFVRERTFYPALGLVQVAAGERISLVDPVAIDDLSPFGDLLADQAVLKVLHSCSEDLEVFEVHFGILPEPLFDTQIAAAVAGRGYSSGYARLIDDLFAITVPKGETRSNWMRRPLRPGQLQYAALDVAYLLPSFRRLCVELDALGRGEWLRQEVDRKIRAFRHSPPDHELYKRAGKARRLKPRLLAVLRDLYVWRESEARKRDLPRNFVIKEPVLASLAQHPPRSFQALQEMDLLDRRTMERYGRALLRVIRRALETPEDHLPEPLPPLTDLSGHKGLIARLRAEVSDVAESLGIAPELLANRKTIEQLVRRWSDGAEPLLPRKLRGWQGEVLESRLRALLPASRE